MYRNQAIQITDLLLRIVVGGMFAQHGAMKLFGWFGGPAVPIGSQMGFGGILELVGGILIVLGLLTRPAAFVLSGEMAIAYWQFHADKGPWPAQNHGEAAVLYCFIFLYIAARGAGEYSLDAIRARKSNLPEDTNGSRVAPMGYPTAS